MKEIISVAVVTYNSSETISETLDSILKQNYGSEYLSLIISDDASKDNTIETVEQWLESHGKEFNSVRIVTSKINTGVTQNCNRVWKAVETRWVKSIGGDDLLRENCISCFVEYVSKNPNARAVFSRMQWFGYISKVVPEKYDLPFFDKSASEQHEYLKFKSFNLAPTSFLSAEALDKVGYADERFRNIEDLPLWLRLTQNGFKLSFVNEITVDYRVANSISKSNSRYVNPDFLNDLINIDRMHPLNQLNGIYPKLLKLDTLTLLNGKLFIKSITNNRKNATSKILDYILFMARPVYVIIKIKKFIINKTT